MVFCLICAPATCICMPNSVLFLDCSLFAIGAGMGRDFVLESLLLTGTSHHSLLSMFTFREFG